MEEFLTQNLKGYELRERIGSGGFGAVYRAIQSTVGREVAIKIILPGLANQPEFIRRFEGEAQIVAHLEHPHITPLYDYWRDPNGAYLVMRWLRGGSLRDALQNSAYDLRSAALLLDQVAGALSLAHRNKVIHRDIKPGNILLDEDGNAYLTDFGIAKDLNIKGNNTLPDAIVGSLDYISPEQARSEPITPRTDVYSLGVTFYEVITGEHPFLNVSAVERLYKHINDPLPEITTLDATLCIQVNRVIQKATAKNPEHRYPDALAFAVDFREAIGLNRSPSNAVEMLTQREQEVLQLIIDGHANKEIAQRLTVTLSTIKWYVNQIYTKLGVRSRVQAMVRARELNLLAKSSENRSFTTIPTEDFQPENPYKGLCAFQSADNQDFFGRENVTAKLVKRLQETHEFKRFLAVIGPSGSGKSSLVKAGLIPALWRGELPGSEKWFIVEMLPGVHPLDELEIALTRIAANQSGSLNEQLSRDRRGLIRAAQLILPNDGSELVLVIDQFEEVFTLLEDESARSHFLDLLYTSVTEPRSRIRIIITLRADFYDRPLHYTDFGELVRSRMETILPLSAQELERAIMKPAERTGVSFEEGLVASIVAEINYQAGALPLVQYALTELFEQRKGRLLSREAYDAVGGSVGALARRADEIYLDFDDASQEAAQQMFLRLVTLGEGVEDTRRRVSRSELLAIAADAERMDEVIDTYAEYRLLSLDNDPGSRAPTVELAHEAILRAWQRLHNWLNANRDEIKSQRQLSVMAAEWREAKQDSSYLARGARLEQFENWVKATSLALTATEREFVEISLNQREKEQAAETERQIREKQLEARSQRFLQSLVVVLLLALVGAFGLTGFALNQRQQAEEERDNAQELALDNGAQAAFANNDLDTALTLSLAANSTDNPSAFSQLQLAQAAYTAGTSRVLTDARYTEGWVSGALSPDEQFLVTSSYLSHSLYVWDLVSGEVVRVFPQVHEDLIGYLAFRPATSAENLEVLSASGDGTMILWDFEQGIPLRIFNAHRSAVFNAQFSADGQQILSASADGTLILWDVDSGEILQTFTGHQDIVVSGVFGLDGLSIFSASQDETVLQWDIETAEVIDRFEIGITPFGGLALSPNGQQFLVTSYQDFTMSLWDIESHSEIRRFGNGPLGQPHFARDGQTVFASEGNFTTFWNIETGAVIRSLAGHTSGANIIVTAEEDTIITVSIDATVRIWDLRGGAELTRSELQYIGNDGDLSPDGLTFVTASGGLTLRYDIPGFVSLFDAATGEELRRFGVDGAAHTANASSVRFSPNGQTILSADWSGEIKLWDVTSGTLIRQYYGMTLPISSIDFSSDGTTFITSSDESATGATFNIPSDENGVTLWDTATGTIIQSFDFDVPVLKTIYSPDSSQFLACLKNESFTIVLVDIASGQIIQHLLGQRSACEALAFSRDGQTSVSGHMDSSILLWDLSHGQLIRPFVNSQGRVSELIFSPNGQTVFSGGFSRPNVLTMWDVATGEPYRKFAGHSRPITGLALSADGKTLLSVSIDSTARLWRIDSQAELIAWTHANRYIRDLTCTELELYQLDPLCD